MPEHHHYIIRYTLDKPFAWGPAEIPQINTEERNEEMTKFVTLLHGENCGEKFAEFESFLARADDIRMVEFKSDISDSKGRAYLRVYLRDEVSDLFDTAEFFICLSELDRIHPFEWDGKPIEA